ncbi:hypothetical protein PVMG_00003 [Plasmodium vivax Mauritania I]|uniref:Variable surface protein Vir7-like protein n=1 Tax=Plasmodium vivax Mauritania I TaxID=1035515 RepID=A0A0J9T7Q5_PLAVI|nr:hypothetical protein PVMG_00003 [Plasmodium vivax Mauritania I]
MFNDKAKEILGEHTELSVVSEIILKALCYVHSKSMRLDFNNDICNFMFFWIGDKILNHLSKKQFFEEIMLNLFESLNGSGTHKICDYHYNNINEENFQNVKLIFDYSEDYISYEKQITGHNPPCNHDYKQYLQKYVESYKIFYDKCTVERLNYNYCEAFTKYFNGKKHDLLSTWTCKLSENLSPPEERFEEVDGEASESPKLRERPVIEAHNALTQRGSKDVRLLDAKFPFPRVTDLDMNTLGLGSATAPTDNPSIASKSITGAVSVAGILVPSYLMYNVIRIIIIKLNVIFYILLNSFIFK